MTRFATVADRIAIESEMPWEDRGLPESIPAFLGATAARFPERPALSFQLTSGPKDRAETWSWSRLQREVTQVANLLRGLGIGPGDTVAFVLPNSLETVAVLLGGMSVGQVCPINPLLEPGQIAGILRETGAKVVVSIKALPRTDIAARVAAALVEAPGVSALIEIDLARYLGPPKRWIVPFLRPRHPVRHGARVLDYAQSVPQAATQPLFEEPGGDGVAAIFHTGGTTGLPKLARHRARGMIYNGWLGADLLFDEKDVLICPLPLFHVFAAYPILMSCIASGAHMVLPTPAGYRGEGVFDNFWKLIERWQVSFLITVPTAIAALMQRPVDADVSSLRIAISGSAPLPVELYNRFRAATGVEIAEGYGLTEATCLVSCNPPEGPKKVGSVGLAMPYSEVRILDVAADGTLRDCAIDEIGEICVASPGVNPGSGGPGEARNQPKYAGRFLRTGDLGRIDADGYIWITGRAKDLIIRGGHNIDPAMIEAALLSHPAVAFAGAIGQPDAFAGELPCAYVELVAGQAVTVAELLEHARAHVGERAAVPKHVEILPELPKTAVGKIFKPALRRLAIARVLDAALAEAGLDARVLAVVEDPRRGLVARISGRGDARMAAVLARFTTPWEAAAGSESADQG